LRAATLDRSTFGLTPVPRDRGEAEAYLAQAIADREAGRGVPFAIMRRGAREELVGSTRFMSFEWWNWPPGPIAVADEPRRKEAGDPPDVCEIGAVWLTPSAQRTAVNSAHALLLMTHAFEVWRVHRLVLKTDARNQRSRAAITRLGATFEGILRAHAPAADGIVRDTAMFSLVPDEWPALRKRLESALAVDDNS
jgi:RimJ/RimL family protein N-acetyltransferase